MKRATYFFLPLLMVFALIGCGPAIVTEKKVVSMGFKGTLADGTVFGESEPSKPLEFMVGAGKMIPALEKDIMGMKIGEKKRLQIKAADAYGEYDKAALQEIPRDQFPKDADVKVGERFSVQTPQGPLTVMIAEIKAKVVVVDFNHPLAGKDLTFDLEIVNIRDATKAELAQAVQQQQTPPAQPQ